MIARCPYCSAGILAAQAFCSSCGRQLPGAAPGLPPQAGMYAPQAMPAPLASASPASPGGALFPQAAQAGKEKRHHWIWLGSLITLGVSGWILYAHWQGTVGLGVALALFALAALSLGLSRFGARWQRASCLEKLLIVPGVLAGLVVLVFIALSGSDSESSQSSKGSSHSKSDHAQSSAGERAFENLFDSDEHGESGRRANRLHFQTCPRCGQIVPSDLRICPRCGQPLP